MKILRALRFPLRRPLRLVALALAQSLFLWLMIAAFEATYSRPNDFEGIVILLLFFGSLLCSAFWLHGSNVASLQRALAGHNALAPQRASHFKPRGVGPVVTSLVLIAYFVLFLALAGMPTHVLRMVSSLGVMMPNEALNLIALHALVIGPGMLVSLVFFVSLTCHAAEDVGLHIETRRAGLFHPRKNLAATVRYLIWQFLLLGIAAIAFNLGLELVSAITPRDMGVILDDPNATTWWFIVIFAGSAVVHIFWYASLYLLADYVLETS